MDLTKDITRLLIKGVAPKNISIELKISYATVRSHLTKLFYKYSVTTTQELICRIYMNKIKKLETRITELENKE